jgi:U3 small nucleolar RNA-associated protein 20
MLNLKYEYNDGRVSAIRLASILIDKLPSEALDQDAQLMFLPLVLQMNNDDSEECRESVSRCLLKLVDRVSVAVANSFHEYLLRWHKGDNPLLRRASLQLFGIFVEGRKEVLKFTDISVTSILECLLISLSAKDDDWEEHYFGLVSLEKVLTNLPSERINQDDRLWAAVISELSHSHLWVKLVASRLISKQLHNMDPTNIDNKSFLATRKGSLFDIAKSMCGHFGLNDNGNDTWNQLSKLAIKSLVWIARAVKNHADLFFATDALQGESGSPLEWLMTCLSNVARPKGSVRRQSIYKCFAAIQQATPLTEYLHLMLEPLHRSTLEAAGTKDYMGHEKSSEEADLAKEVMHLLEEAYDESFVQALAQVKLRARDRKDVRKTNESLSGNKVQKQVRERQRRKRRVEERRDERGGIAKKRHL